MNRLTTKVPFDGGNGLCEYTVSAPVDNGKLDNFVTAIDGVIRVDLIPQISKLKTNSKADPISVKLVKEYTCGDTTVRLVIKLTIREKDTTNTKLLCVMDNAFVETHRLIGMLVDKPNPKGLALTIELLGALASLAGALSSKDEMFAEPLGYKRFNLDPSVTMGGSSLADTYFGSGLMKQPKEPFRRKLVEMASIHGRT